MTSISKGKQGRKVYELVHPALLNFVSPEGIVNNQQDFLPRAAYFTCDENKKAMAVVHSNTITRTTYITIKSTINYQTSSKLISSYKSTQGRKCFVNCEN